MRLGIYGIGVALPAALGLVYAAVALRLYGSDQLGIMLIVLASTGTLSSLVVGWYQQAFLRFRGSGSRIVEREYPPISDVLMLCAAALGFSGVWAVASERPDATWLVALVPLDVLYRLAQTISQATGSALRFAATTGSFSILRVLAMMSFASRGGFEYLAVAQLLGLAGGLLTWLMMSWSSLRREDTAISRDERDLLRWLAFGLPLSALAFLGEFRPLVDRALLAGLLGLEAVGKYGTVVSMGTAFAGLAAQPLMLLANPNILLAAARSGPRVAAILLLQRATHAYVQIVTPLVIVALLLAPEVCRIVLGDADLSNPLRLVLLAAWFSGLALYLGKVFEIRGKTQFLLIGSVAGLGVAAAGFAVLPAVAGDVGAAAIYFVAALAPISIVSAAIGPQLRRILVLRAQIPMYLGILIACMLTSWNLDSTRLRLAGAVVALTFSFLAVTSFVSRTRAT